MNSPILYWFRRDLRLSDLPGLCAAAAHGPVIPCYIHDTPDGDYASPGGASAWWLHHNLSALEAALEQQGSRLIIRSGPVRKILPALVEETGATAVHCSRSYDPGAAELEAQLHDTLAQLGVAFKRFPGSLLFEPEAVSTQAGTPFRVFTPFWRQCRQQWEPAQPLAAPAELPHPDAWPEGMPLDALQLLPTPVNWAQGWENLWQPGEAGAQKALDTFMHNALADYPEHRDIPGVDGTSRLSPHLHFGALSPRQLAHVVLQHSHLQPEQQASADKFLAELGWREFSHHLLFHFSGLPHESFNERFEGFPWQGSPAALKSWQQGQTGYPLVDAGMRELWHTGYMHNRVRMVVGSFLCKHLLLPWQAGQRWFWDTLVDADLANNACSWQWVAGCGADAAPYFRVFNPTLQGRKFDPEGDYIRRWVPELAALPSKHIHEPHAAPENVLAKASVKLGQNYPYPIVEHRAAREAALTAYQSLGSK